MNASALLLLIYLGSAVQTLGTEVLSGAEQPIPPYNPIRSRVWIVAATESRPRILWTAVGLRDLDQPPGDLYVSQALKLLEYCLRERLVLSDGAMTSSILRVQEPLAFPAETRQFLEKTISLIRSGGKSKLALEVLPAPSALSSHSKAYYANDSALGLVGGQTSAQNGLLQFTANCIELTLRYQREALKDDEFDRKALSDGSRPTLKTVEHVWRSILVEGFRLPCKSVQLSPELMVLFLEFEGEVALGETIGRVFDGSIFEK